MGIDWYIFLTIPIWQIFTNQFCTVTFHLKKSQNLSTFFLKIEISLKENDLGLWKKTILLNKSIEVFKIKKKIGWFVSLEVEKIIIVEKQFLLLNYNFVKNKTKENPKSEI